VIFTFAVIANYYCPAKFLPPGPLRRMSFKKPKMADDPAVHFYLGRYCCSIAPAAA
jgi:hypothetical protein